MKQPTVYEINTPVFLTEVAERVGYPMTLASVPDDVWDTIADYGQDTVWFMGVWKRSEVARTMALRETWLREALPGVEDQNIIGSAYSIQDYVVDEALGGNEALAIARAKLKERGMSMLLDYVPNHVGIDHPWTVERPDYFMSGTAQDLQKDPVAFIEVGGRVIAKGKDPHFIPWSDVLQLNAFSLELRQEVTGVLERIASMCDGVRCDMAMLMMNDVFANTWGARAGKRPDEDYWPSIIGSVKADHPEFLFLAEVYWGKEDALVKQGFDFCYDKDFYDDLLNGASGALEKRLHQPLTRQKHLMRFIENHDEERAANIFSPEQHKAAALISLTLPGMRLFHHGQLEGARVKLPVHLSRRKEEVVDEDIRVCYKDLLGLMKKIDFEHDEWRVVRTHAGFLQRESRRILAWSWTGEQGTRLIVVNYSPHQASARLEGFGNKTIHFEPWQTMVIEPDIG